MLGVTSPLLHSLQQVALAAFSRFSVCIHTQYLSNLSKSVVGGACCGLVHFLYCVYFRVDGASEGSRSRTETENHHHQLNKEGLCEHRTTFDPITKYRLEGQKRKR